MATSSICWSEASLPAPTMSGMSWQVSQAINSFSFETSPALLTGVKNPVRFSDGGGFYPAVTIAVSKRKGTNAVTVAEAVLARLEPQRGGVIPSDVEMTITRHYGDTAKEKSNEYGTCSSLSCRSVS